MGMMTRYSFDDSLYMGSVELPGIFDMIGHRSPSRSPRLAMGFGRAIQAGSIDSTMRVWSSAVASEQAEPPLVWKEMRTDITPS